MKTLNIIKLTGLLLPCTFTVFAQKLPNKQEAAVFAPANIKIDGKTTEWGDKFQAYNKATEVFYTIANDNENLYLTVQATEPLIARKIIAGGITFTISGADKSKNKEGVSVTYPVFDKSNPAGINLRNKPDTNKLDSLKNAINKQLIQKAKEIKLSGINAINSDLISVYNEHDIKVAAVFDDKIAYTYELALPLKYVQPIVNKQTKFNYTITLNGSNQSEGYTFELIEGGIRINHNGISGKPPAMGDMQYIASPTNFTGEYTLAKK